MAGRRDRKDLLLEAGLALASELSLPIVLQRIVDVATQVTDARYGAIGVIGARNQIIEFVTTGISAKERRAIGALPSGHGVLGLLIRDPRPIRLKDIASHPKAVGFPSNHPPMHTFLGAPVRAVGRVYGNIYLAEKRGGGQFTEEDEASLILLATQAGVAIANATLYEETHLRERWLGALRDITADILSGADSESVLSEIAEHAQQLAGADLAVIVSATSNPDQLSVDAAAGNHATDLKGQSVPADRSISGEVMRSGKTLVLADAGADRRAYLPIIRTGKVGPAIFVPLRVQGRATGTLMVANVRGGRAFDDRTTRLVETFADQASVAVEYGRAQLELRRLGLLEERERIAKELHDGIIQALFAVGMGLQGTALVAGSPETAARIEGAVGELDRVIHDLRNYIFGLRPGILADRALDQALRTLAEEFQARSGVTVQVEVDPTLASLLSARAHEIVQLTREALSNVSRHSQATHAMVRLVRDGSEAVLSVEDNGVGFDPRRDSTGHGLRNMRERAASFGGRMQIKSAAGKGTRLRVPFPVAERQTKRTPRPATRTPARRQVRP
jgi:signal transduction histidine kinase